MESNLNDLEGLRIAMDIESRGYRFYQMAYDKFSDPKTKELFKTLRDEEEVHLQTFTKYFEEIEKTKEAHSTEYLFDDEYSGYLTALAETHVFPKEKDAAQALSAIKTPVDALRLALQAEKDSVLFYGELVECSKFESAREVFGRLREEERHHTVAIAKRLALLRQG